MVLREDVKGRNIIDGSVASENAEACMNMLGVLCLSQSYQHKEERQGEHHS